MVHWIEESVKKATGVATASDIAHIIDLMASQCQTFAGLSPERFDQLAIEARELVRHMQTPAGKASLTDYKAKYGIADWSQMDRHAPQPQ